MRFFAEVSVLFSEPKIPQSIIPTSLLSDPRSFSALQRAENSSIGGSRIYWRGCWSVSVLFSEPKIPQSHQIGAVVKRGAVEFQCSSASRKFLNPS